MICKKIKKLFFVIEIWMIAFCNNVNKSPSKGYSAPKAWYWLLPATPFHSILHKIRGYLAALIGNEWNLMT